MTENEEKPSLGGATSEYPPSALEARVQELESQMAELQKQVATLTKMLDRIVRPANKFVSGIVSGISAVKEHLKKPEDQLGSSWILTRKYVKGGHMLQ